jgi:hypothetical protein
LPAKTVNLKLLWPQLSMAGQGMLRISVRIADPLAQHVLVQVQIPRSLRNRNATLLHQPHCLKLELAVEFPSALLPVG